MRSLIAFLTSINLIFAPFLYADTVIFKDGEIVEGIIIEEADAEIKFKEYVAGSGYVISVYKKDELKNIARASDEENLALIEEQKRLQAEQDEEMLESQQRQEPVHGYRTREERVSELQEEERFPHRHKQVVDEQEEELQKQRRELERQHFELERQQRIDEKEREKEIRRSEREDQIERPRQTKGIEELVGENQQEIINRYGTPTYKEVQDINNELWIYNIGKRKYTVTVEAGLVVDIKDEPQ